MYICDIRPTKKKMAGAHQPLFLLPFSSRIRSLSFSCEFKWQATHFQFLHSSINEVWHLGHAHWLNLFERKVHNAAIFKSEKTTTHMQFLSTFEVKHSRVNCVRRFRVLLAVISLQYVFLLGWLSDWQTQIETSQLCVPDIPFSLGHNTTKATTYPADNTNLLFLNNARWWISHVS